MLRQATLRTLVCPRALWLPQCRSMAGKYQFGETTSFEDFIERSPVYVNKMETAIRLMAGTKGATLLTAPRRMGKSMLL